MGDVSKNFNRSEFACQGKDCCGGAAPIHPDLLAGVQALRDLVERPLHINSGFRCPKHNSAIGGVKNSYHMLAMAADIAVPSGMTPDDFAAFAEQVFVFHNGGIGIYASWIHVDIRKEKTRWRK